MTTDFTITPIDGKRFIACPVGSEGVEAEGRCLGNYSLRDNVVKAKINGYTSPNGAMFRHGGGILSSGMGMRR